jgi:hypothetical protein
VVAVYNNVIRDVANGPEPTDGTSGMACVYVTGYYEQASGIVDVYNNTCVNAGSMGFDASRGAFVRLTYAPNLTLRLRNNVVRQQSGQRYVNSSNGGVNGSNNLWFGVGNGPALTTANINADPMFVNFAARDLHLLSNSPAVDSGVAVGLPRDFDNNVRDSLPDRGAYEQPGSSDVIFMDGFES